eukprot:gene55661-52498_t
MGAVCCQPCEAAVRRSTRTEDTPVDRELKELMVPTYLGVGGVGVVLSLPYFVIGVRSRVAEV